MPQEAISPNLIAALSSSNPQAYSDFVIKQQQLARNQAMARALMQQTMQPEQTQEVSGRVVPYSPWQGLSRLAQAWMAGKMNQKNDQQAGDIATQQGQMYSQAMASALAKMQSATGDGATSPSAPTPSQPAPVQASEAQPGSGGSVSANAVPNQTVDPQQTQALIAQLRSSSQPASEAPAPVQITNSSVPPTGTSSGGSPLVSGGSSSGLPSKLLSVAADPMVNAMFPQLASKFGEGAVTASLPTDVEKNASNPIIGPSVVSNLKTQNMTPVQKLQLARSLVPDGSPQANQLDAAIGKENYVSPVEVGSNKLVLDPATHQPIAYNGSYADGVVPKFSTSGGFTSPASASAVPGYAGASSGIAGAEQGAKQGNSIFTVDGPGGSKITNWGSSLAGGRGSAATPQPASASPVSANAPGAPQVAAPVVQPATNQRGGTVGQSTTDQQINEAAGKAWAQLPQNIVQAKQARAGLESALTALDSTTTGPGTGQAFSLAATLQNMGLPVARTPTENYQTLTKYLNNALSLSAGVNGNTGSDSRFEQFMHGQPSADLMNKGPLRGAINYVLSQIDAVPAGAQVMQSAYQAAKAAGDPNAAYTAQKAWSDAYDPRVFQFNRMSPDEKASFKAQLMKSDPSGAAAKAFGQKYNQFHANNWVN